MLAPSAKQAMVPAASTRLRNSASGSIGSGARRSCRTIRVCMMTEAATSSVNSTMPRCVACTSANIKRPVPATIRIEPE